MEDDPKEVEPDLSRILMSDILRDVMPSNLQPDDNMEALANNYIIVVLGRTVGAESTPLVGTLLGFTFEGKNLEVEARVQLEDALDLTSGSPYAERKVNVNFQYVELHEGENVRRFQVDDGETYGFELAGARLGPIDYKRKMCTLLLSLRAT